MVRFQLFHAGELVRHFILHTVDILIIDLHFFVHATFKIAYFLQVSSTSVYFDLKRSCCTLSLIQLTLFEVEVLFHLLDLVHSRQGSLSIQVLTHVLKQSCDSLLSIRHLSRHLLLFSLILLCKLIDLLLLLIQHLKLLFAAHTTGTFWSIAKLTLDVLDIAIVLINHLAQVANLLVLLLDLRIVLLDAVHETLSSFRERQVVFIALKLQVIFALLQLGFLFA